MVPVELSGAMAFSLADGKVVWKQGSYEVSYASPVLLTLLGTPQVVFYTAARAVGAVLFREGRGKRGALACRRGPCRTGRTRPP